MGYELNKEIIVFTRATVDILLSKNTDALALYAFYIKTSDHQKTNQIYAVDKFCQQGLGWGRKRFEKAKKVLVDERLVEYIKKRNSIGKIEKHYVRVNYKWKEESKSHLYQKEQVGETPKVKQEVPKKASHMSLYPQVDRATSGKGTTNALSSYNLNAYSSNKLETKKNTLKTEHQYYAIEYVAPLLGINIKKAEKQQKGITGSFIKVFKDSKTKDKAKSVVGTLTESRAFKEYDDLRKIKTIFSLLYAKKG